MGNTEKRSMNGMKEASDKSKLMEQTSGSDQSEFEEITKENTSRMFVEFKESDSCLVVAGKLDNASKSCKTTRDWVSFSNINTKAMSHVFTKAPSVGAALARKINTHTSKQKGLRFPDWLDSEIGYQISKKEPPAKIAKKLGVSRESVQKRLAKIEAGNILLPGGHEHYHPAITVNVMRLLIIKMEEVYDAANNRYTNGWTDSKIANELRLSAADVAWFRYEIFGPTGVESELESALETVAELERELSAFLDKHEQLRNEILLVGNRLESVRDRIKREYVAETIK